MKSIIFVPLFFSLFGFVFTSRKFLLFYDKFPPYGGLVFYYFILFFTILFLQYIGLEIGGIKYTDWKHTIGTMLILFAFFIVVDWESCYINIVTKGSCNKEQFSNIYLASEDGAVFDLYSRIFPKKNNLNRILTYVITPFILGVIGLYLNR